MRIQKVDVRVQMKNSQKLMLKNQPLVSIITVVYNGEKYLEQTINSVINQTYDNIEYIIIDGDSQDNTLEIIKKHDQRISYWSSEPDKGIYDAMNKGLSRASGDIVAFLNADDWYELDAIESIVNVFLGNNNVDFVFGDVIQLDPVSKEERTYRVRLNEAKRLMPFGHPALFVKTDIHKKIPFDLSFKIAADYDFVLTLLDKKFQYQYLNKRITNFRLEGISSTENLMNENYIVLKKHYGMFYAIYGLSTNVLLNYFWKCSNQIFSEEQTSNIKLFLKKKFYAKS